MEGLWLVTLEVNIDGGENSEVHILLFSPFFPFFVLPLLLTTSCAPLFFPFFSLSYSSSKPGITQNPANKVGSCNIYGIILEIGLQYQDFFLRLQVRRTHTTTHTHHIHAHTSAPPWYMPRKTETGDKSAILQNFY